MPNSVHADSGIDRNRVKMMQPGLIKPSISEDRCDSHSSI
jgi:hypothetical protein